MDWFAKLQVLARAQVAAGDEALAPDWANDVVGFWFEELAAADWFTKSDATDDRIGERFLKVYHQVSQMPVAELSQCARTALAGVIVLDQFPRNLFRGHRQSFETDPKARALAKAAIDAGFDREMTDDERVFLYLPFEHSEALADQERAVQLISAIGNDNYTHYAVAHLDVIKQFGRFPHRNEALERVSTAQEAAYLARPGSGF